MCGGCTWHGNNTTDDEKATRQSICRGEQMIMLCCLPLFTLVSSVSISALTEADLGYCCALFDVAGFLDYPYWFASIFNTYYFTTTSVTWKASDFIANMSCLAQLVALRSTPRMHVCTCFVNGRLRYKLLQGGWCRLCNLLAPRLYLLLANRSLTNQGYSR